MSKREIFFGGGSPYRMCEIVYAEIEKGTITGKYMIARDDSGAEHIVCQMYGTWGALSPIDLVEALKERDRLREKAQPRRERQAPRPGDTTRDNTNW